MLLYLYRLLGLCDSKEINQYQDRQLGRQLLDYVYSVSHRGDNYIYQGNYMVHNIWVARKITGMTVEIVTSNQACLGIYESNYS